MVRLASVRRRERHAPLTVPFSSTHVGSTIYQTYHNVNPVEGIMARPKVPEAQIGFTEIDRLWEWTRHQDDLLATRVSVFLLAQSILIAVTAALINTIANMKFGSAHPVRLEVFVLVMVMSVAGLLLTLIFWYVFTLNFITIGALTDELDRHMYQVNPKNVRLRIKAEVTEHRRCHWFYRVAFRQKGMNWMVVNVLPAIFLFLWLATTTFSLIIFFFQ